MPKPANNTYRLTPAVKYDRPAYDVEVTDDGLEQYPLTTKPWDAGWNQFRVTLSGNVYGYTCGSGTYSHWSIDNGTSPATLTILDDGECEAV